MVVCDAKTPKLAGYIQDFLGRPRPIRAGLENGFQKGIQGHSSNKVGRQLAW